MPPRWKQKSRDNIVSRQVWKSITYCLKCVGLLTKVLRLVDGDAKPVMGYVYEAMDIANEQIAKNFKTKDKI